MKRWRSRIGQNRRSPPTRAAIASTLLILALFLRVLVPAGWMPAAGGSYAITLCTGAGMAKAWVDGEGRVHKEERTKGGIDHPCAFAGFGSIADLPPLLEPVFHLFAAAIPVLMPVLAVAIGRGLAAPPPPATGPPSRL